MFWVVCLNPPMGPNYFNSMGKFMKNQDRNGNFAVLLKMVLFMIMIIAVFLAVYVVGILT